MNSTVLLVLRTACFFLFVGRAWQHLMWDIPIRALLWDQLLLENIVHVFGYTWEAWVTDPKVEMATNLFVKSLGIFYCLCALLTLHINTVRRGRNIFLFASFPLMLLAVLQYKEHFFQFGQLFEYSVQIGTPILLWYSQQSSSPNMYRIILAIKVLIALTFSCHGLYAIGYYPRSGRWIDWVISIMHLSEPLAHKFLFIAGMVDLFVSALIFVPGLSRLALVYAFVWGGLTALARIVANFSFDFPFETINQYLFETLCRFPHSLFPLIALLLIKGKHADG